MRQAGTEYLQEEGRPRGARPRLRAVVYPFDLDYGLSSGSGVFDHTVYGGEPGNLALAEGYITSGSWTSPVMQAFSPYLDLLLPAWEDLAGYLETNIFLRSHANPEKLAVQPFQPLTLAAEADVAPYFQVRVEFQEEVRAWAVDTDPEADAFTAYGVDQAPAAGFESFAVDGEFPGVLRGLRLEGRLTLPESEILDPGSVRVELARDFSELRTSDHLLVMDNRQRQWVPGGGNFYFLGWPWHKKKLDLYHGWELPAGKVEWLLLYTGALERLADMAHAWQAPHLAQLDTQDWIGSRLQRMVGGPAPDGERRPFLHGAYRLRGELRQTVPAFVSEPVKNGSGSGILKAMGNYRGEFSQNFLVEAENSGEVGAASFRWSTNQGQSWQGTGIFTAGPENPVALTEGLSVCWLSGPGEDLVVGDRWNFTALPTAYHYQLCGAPFAGITEVFLNDEAVTEGVEADPDTGLVQVLGKSAQVAARVVKDAVTHPVDIIMDILTTVGLSEVVDRDSFALAKSLTPNYAIGVCFENISAAQALREILGRCLYDLWVDFGEVKIRPYLGDD